MAKPDLPVPAIELIMATDDLINNLNHGLAKTMMRARTIEDDDGDDDSIWIRATGRVS